MGLSKSYSISSLRTGVTRWKDYARLPITAPRPLRPGVIRTWFDINDTMCFITQSGPVVKVVTESYP